MNYPYLTTAFAGVGGTIKDNPEDFIVEEIPAYAPCGHGEHLYLRVEKKGMSTFAMMQRIATALGIREQEIGYAGLKDAQAISRQTISLPPVDKRKIAKLDIENITILDSNYHTNKLRLGHLHGNRFHIAIHEVVEDAEQRALDILNILEHTGVPNFFGSQRYGVLGSNHLVGKAIVGGEFSEAAQLIIGNPEKISNQRWQQAATAYCNGNIDEALATLPGRFRDERRLLHALLKGKDHRQAVLTLPRKLLRLYLSAYQSHLFDRQVQMRLDSIDILWPGDIAYIHNKGACFRVEDSEAEQPRADRLEISPSGMLPGHKVMYANGQTGIIEQALLEKEKLNDKSFNQLPGLKLSGERRPLRVPLKQTNCRQQHNTLHLSFALPTGSFATTVLNEVIKSTTASDKG
ncbi:MAG: tRNA pseudouridine(13) synthase TruD [Desulfobacteraceae bacterium 4572_35.1]|nr:MAG: tRNA pseudouridine(13) synthase TruD [Desulfobacteraceae bacterium 4572_35.1]